MQTPQKVRCDTDPPMRPTNLACWWWSFEIWEGIWTCVHFHHQFLKLKNFWKVLISQPKHTKLIVGKPFGQQDFIVGRFAICAWAHAMCLSACACACVCLRACARVCARVITSSLRHIPRNPTSATASLQPRRGQVWGRDKCADWRTSLHPRLWTPTSLVHTHTHTTQSRWTPVSSQETVQSNWSPCAFTGMFLQPYWALCAFTGPVRDTHTIPLWCPCALAGLYLQHHWALCAFTGPVRDTPTIPLVSLYVHRDTPILPWGSLCLHRGLLTQDPIPNPSWTHTHLSFPAGPLICLSFSLLYSLYFVSDTFCHLPSYALFPHS